MRYSNDRIIALTPTDLPEPVVPAIIRCGIRARSATIALPLISFPNASDSRPADFCTSSLERISLRNTVSRLLFGTSMPITLRPGNGGDAHGGDRQAAGDVVREPDHPGAANAGRRHEFI